MCVKMQVYMGVYLVLGVLYSRSMTILNNVVRSL